MMSILTTLGLGLFMLTAESGSPGTAAAELARDTQALLDSLDEEQRTQATIPFNSDEPLNWHYTAKARQGIPLDALDEAQREKAGLFKCGRIPQSGANSQFGDDPA